MPATRVSSLFELRQLRCFVAAAEELHFGRAAARVNMTQPPLSRQIQLLERVLGVKLLDRTSRVVKLTPAGRVFLLEARRILRLTESAALTTRRTASGEAGTIALGFTAASGYSFLPRLISLCTSRLPNVNISLKEMVTADQTEALQTGRIDVGLLRPPVDRMEFTRLRIATEPLVAALPSGDPRLAKASLTLADFDRQPLIMYASEGARYFHDMLVGLFDAHRVTPLYVQYLAQIHSAIALVHSGLGAALVPEAAMSLHFDGVQFRPVITSPAHPVELYMVWRSDNDNPALEPLLDLVRHDFAHPGAHSNEHPELHAAEQH
jgi:DNA-binding transcriptional LysR family regulator